jgi:hypothetical protein
MADKKQREAAANLAFFEQKAREYTRETGQKWSAKDVADYFEGTVREMSVYGTDAKAASRAWDEVAKYNSLDAPNVEYYPGDDKVEGWNSYKSATSITRDAIEWATKNGLITGAPADIKSLNEKIQRSFNNIDSLSSLPAGFEEAVSTSNARLAQVPAPMGGTLANMMGNRNKPTPSLASAFPNYTARGLLSQKQGQLQSLQGQKAGTSFQRALETMRPSTGVDDNIIDRAIGAKRGELAKIEQDLQRLANRETQLISNALVDYGTGRGTKDRLGVPSGFNRNSIPQMTRQGVYNVARPGDGTLKAGFASTVPQSANIAARTFEPTNIAYQRGLTAPSYPQAIPMASTFDTARFNNMAAPQANMTPNDVRNSYHSQLAGNRTPVPTPASQTISAPSRTSTVGANSFFADPRVGGYVPGAMTGRGAGTINNQFSPAAMPNVSYSTPPDPVRDYRSPLADRSAVDKLNNSQRALGAQLASYGMGGPAIDVNPALPDIDPIDIPGSAYKQAPAPVVPGPVGTTRGVTTNVPTATEAQFAPPPSNIPNVYNQASQSVRAPGILGILGGMVQRNENTLPGILGVIQNAVQGIRNPQQAQQATQAVQTVAPALGQVMGLPAAQQAAKAGNNMVIGRDARGILGWMADGGLSAGAANAGWMSNNPERYFGGYGGGYDPTPV